MCCINVVFLYELAAVNLQETHTIIAYHTHIRTSITLLYK